MLLPRVKLATRISAWKEQLVMETPIPQPGAGSISQNPRSDSRQGSGESPSPRSVCRDSRYQKARSAVGKAAEQLRGLLSPCHL